MEKLNILTLGANVKILPINVFLINFVFVLFSFLEEGGRGVDPNFKEIRFLSDTELLTVA